MSGKETVAPWVIEMAKAKLLESARGNLTPLREFPDTLVLNNDWIRLFEEVYWKSVRKSDGTISLQEHPEENCKLVKTDAARKIILAQNHNQSGNSDSVVPDLSTVRYPEILLGFIHKHPAETLFSTEDVLTLLKTFGQFFEGLITPANYYLAFRTQETPHLGDLQTTSRGYVLAMARSHHQRVGTHSIGVLAATMTPAMFTELNIPLYRGARGQNSLERLR